MEIGKLKEVELRNLWKHEQYDFSEWLSQNENIELLNDILGLTLTDISKEVYVGSYRCDLVAVDESSGIKVIIENQLEKQKGLNLQLRHEIEIEKSTRKENEIKYQKHKDLI